jgi:hypothetical protein
MADQQVGLGWQPWNMNRLNLEQFVAGRAYMQAKLDRLRSS